MIKLKFSKGNAKLEKDTAIFSLPAGYTCPAALLCFSRANKVTGKIEDGKETKFRCYAASAEVLFPNIRKSRWNNFNALKGKTTAEMTALILASLPTKGIKLCRIHASGDFFSQAYFDAWLAVAKALPQIIFYAYTKTLPFWVARKNEIPLNFRIVASRGGKFDAMIEKENLRNVTVVFSESEAANLGLPIDHDDTHAWNTTRNFALLLHGTQPKGTEASKMLYQLRKQGKGGYKADYFAHYSKPNTQN